MSTLLNQLAVAETEDVARGIRLLLRRPLITQAADPDAFDLIRRRQQPLRAWFDHHCGWALLVEPRLGYARLAKVGTADDATRPARRLRSGRAPFDRRRYALLCVVAAELLSTPVTTIGLLAERVTQASAADNVLPPFDSSHRQERMAFVDAVRLLESFGAVEAVDGISDSFVEAASAKVLYRVNTTLLVRLLAAPRSPSHLGVPPGDVASGFDRLLRALGEESRYSTRDGGADGPAAEPPGATPPDVRRTLWLRHSILRRLFDEPVLYRDELSAEQRGYLATPTGRQLVRRAAAQAGFVLEERAEGYLLVDAEAIATDVTFPDGGSTAKVAALLLLDRLSAAAGPLTVAELVDAARQALDRFPTWARTYREDDGARRLTDEAVALLAAFRLVRCDGELIHPRPAAARYAVLVTDQQQGVTSR